MRNCDYWTGAAEAESAYARFAREFKSWGTNACLPVPSFAEWLYRECADTALALTEGDLVRVRTARDPERKRSAWHWAVVTGYGASGFGRMTCFDGVYLRFADGSEQSFPVNGRPLDSRDALPADSEEGTIAFSDIPGDALELAAARLVREGGLPGGKEGGE